MLSKFNAIQIKSWQVFLMELDELTLEVMWLSTEPRRVQAV